MAHVRKVTVIGAAHELARVAHVSAPREAKETERSNQSRFTVGHLRGGDAPARELAHVNRIVYEADFYE